MSYSISIVWTLYLLWPSTYVTGQIRWISSCLGKLVLTSTCDRRLGSNSDEGKCWGAFGPTNISGVLRNSSKSVWEDIL